MSVALDQQMIETMGSKQFYSLFLPFA